MYTPPRTGAVGNGYNDYKERERDVISVELKKRSEGERKHAIQELMKRSS